MPRHPHPHPSLPPWTFHMCASTHIQTLPALLGVKGFSNHFDFHLDWINWDLFIPISRCISFFDPIFRLLSIYICCNEEWVKICYIEKDGKLKMWAAFSLCSGMLVGKFSSIINCATQSNRHHTRERELNLNLVGNDVVASHRIQSSKRSFFSLMMLSDDDVEKFQFRNRKKIGGGRTLRKKVSSAQRDGRFFFNLPRIFFSRVFFINLLKTFQHPSHQSRVFKESRRFQPSHIWWRLLRVKPEKAYGDIDADFLSINIFFLYEKIAKLRRRVSESIKTVARRQILLWQCATVCGRKDGKSSRKWKH